MNNNGPASPRTRRLFSLPETCSNYLMHDPHQRNLVPSNDLLSCGSCVTDSHVIQSENHLLDMTSMDNNVIQQNNGDHFPNLPQLPYQDQQHMEFLHQPQQLQMQTLWPFEEFDQSPMPAHIHHDHEFPNWQQIDYNVHQLPYPHSSSQQGTRLLSQEGAISWQQVEQLLEQQVITNWQEAWQHGVEQVVSGPPRQEGANSWQQDIEQVEQLLGQQGVTNWQHARQQGIEQVDSGLIRQQGAIGLMEQGVEQVERLPRQQDVFSWQQGVEQVISERPREQGTINMIQQGVEQFERHPSQQVVVGWQQAGQHGVEQAERLSRQQGVVSWQQVKQQGVEQVKRLPRHQGDISWQQVGQQVVEQTERLPRQPCTINWRQAKRQLKQAGQGSVIGKEQEQRYQQCCQMYLDSLPSGVVFNPTPNEILLKYLKKKIEKKPLPPNRIPEVNLYHFHPNHLTDIHRWTRPHEKDEWYFFTQLEKKYPNGSRPNRQVLNGGYWKASGVDTKFKYSAHNFTGFKKVLEFYEGEYRTGRKTHWKMHEYRIEFSTNSQTDAHSTTSHQLDHWVLCHLYISRAKKSPVYEKKRKKMAKKSSSNSNGNGNGEEINEHAGEAMITNLTGIVSSQPSHQSGDLFQQNQQSEEGAPTNNTVDHH